MLKISSCTLCKFNTLNTHGNDQILISKILHIHINLNTRNMTKTRNLIGTFQHTVQKRSLLKMNVIHTLNKKFTLIIFLCRIAQEMLTDTANIINNRHHSRKVSRSRCTKSPYIIILACQFDMWHYSNTVRNISITAATNTKELIWCKVAHIHIPVLNIDHCMRSMLNCITDNINIRVDLFCTTCDLLDIHNITGNIGSSHNAEKNGILIHILHDLIRIKTTCYFICRNLTELSSGFLTVILDRIMSRWMLQSRSNRILTPVNTFHDRTYCMEHSLGSSQLGNQRTTLCTKDNLKDLLSTILNIICQIKTSAAGTLRTIRELLDSSLSLNSPLKSQRTTRVLKKKSRTILRILICIIKLRFQLLLICI